MIEFYRGSLLESYLNKRKFERYEARFRVNFIGGGAFFSDYSHDLSEGGIRVESINPLEPGTKLKLSLYLPDRPNPLQVEGVVVWSRKIRGEKKEEKGYLGVGVEFEELDPPNRDVIRGMLKALPKIT